MSLSTFISEHLVAPFVRKPGLNLAKGTVAKVLTVEESVAGKMLVDRFIQKGEAAATHLKTGKVLDMTPYVAGGLKEGDIVLRGSSAVCTAQGGWVASVENFFKKFKWKREVSEVSHSGVVVKGADGGWRVIHMVSGKPPAGTEQHLNWFQRKFKATFLRSETPAEFFNVVPTPSTQSTVMRHADAEVASRAAKKAQQLFDSQITASGTHAWYSKLPHGLAPDGRGGVCSTFVDLAFDERFESRLHLPTTPHTFASSPELKQVGDRSIMEIEAAPSRSR